MDSSFEVEIVLDPGVPIGIGGWGRPPQEYNNKSVVNANKDETILLFITYSACGYEGASG